MFAIALYDERRRSLGVGPRPVWQEAAALFVYWGQFLFGSEIKSLLAVHPELAEVDQEAILQYFYFGYIPDPATAFRSIRKLPPGLLARVRDMDNSAYVAIGTCPRMGRHGRSRKKNIWRSWRPDWTRRFGFA